MKNKPHSLAEYLADIITGQHNQHCIIRFTGVAGTGKSWAAVDLAREVAEIVSERKGGTAQDYYSFERDLAVMSKEDITRIMGNPGKYHILHLDDVGVPVNARHYQSNFNIDFNDIIQTFRPNNNLVIMTMQAAFLIDKVPRTLAGIEIEMESANFDEGFTVAKVQKIVLKHKTGKIHYPYLVIDGIKYVRHIFEAPPKELMEEYERIRAMKLKAMNEPAPVLEVQPKLTIKERVQEIHRDFEAGVFGDMTFKDVCKANKINIGYARNVI
jgi:glutaredoxin